MDEPHTQKALQELPSIDELFRSPTLSPLLARHSRPVALAALREAVNHARTRILRGDLRGFDEAEVARALDRLSQPGLRAVLNASGVVLHTNLGRAPLHPRALERICEVAEGYSNLELDLGQGERGSRYAPVVGLLRELTGAEDALVVNNCASAVLLSLSALSGGRESLVSRGELVEIGGGFRVPDVMRQSGAVLVEVGTTNRTRIGDYEAALTANSALLVKVHRSNFALVGFTEEATTKDLSGLARAKGLAFYEDLGSGSLLPLHGEGLTSEPTVSSVIAAGADVVSFSGDKLLGGPQAGIIVGRAAVLEKLKRHPLNRALRIDKLTVAALEATLELYRDGRADEIPVRSMLLETAASLQARAEKLQAALAEQGVKAAIVRTTGQVGGGALPLANPVSYACAIAGDAEKMHQRLREATPPVVARISDNQLLLDVRCLNDDQLGAVAGAAREAAC
ncbi:MAG: L-seryl-tRNA(Sec) selenium transferase [Myxococcaceae bacterium]